MARDWAHQGVGPDVRVSDSRSAATVASRRAHATSRRAHTDVRTATPPAADHGSSSNNTTDPDDASLELYAYVILESNLLPSLWDTIPTDAWSVGARLAPAVGPATLAELRNKALQFESSIRSRVLPLALQAATAPHRASKDSSSAPVSTLLRRFALCTLTLDLPTTDSTAPRAPALARFGSLARASGVLVLKSKAWARAIVDIQTQLFIAEMKSGVDLAHAEAHFASVARDFKLDKVASKRFEKLLKLGQSGKLDRRYPYAEFYRDMRELLTTQHVESLASGQEPPDLRAFLDELRTSAVDLAPLPERREWDASKEPALTNSAYDAFRAIFDKLFTPAEVERMVTAGEYTT